MDTAEGARYIVESLTQRGYVAYFTGGWVRDYIMGHPSSDIDIATNAPPPLILDLFPHTVLVGFNFGVVIVIIAGHQYEVASFRRDISYSNGRKPDAVALGSPEEDALRRDFTINGMFFDPTTEQVFDFVGGISDIKLGVIRTIGNPYERFVEDRLRMVRAVRFSARFGFVIEKETHEAIVANAYSLFPAVAMERIWQELCKMAAGPYFEGAIIEMHRLGLLQEIFYFLRHTHLHDIRQRVCCYPHFPDKCPTILYIVQLFPDATLSELLELCKMFKSSTENNKLVALFWQGRELCNQAIEGIEPISLAIWAHYYAQPHSDLCLKIVAATLADIDRDAFLLGHNLRRLVLAPHIQRITAKSPLVTAAMLKREGIAPGPTMGKILKRAETLAIERDIHEAEALLQQLKKDFLWPNKDTL